MQKRLLLRSECPEKGRFDRTFLLNINANRHVSGGADHPVTGVRDIKVEVREVGQKRFSMFRYGVL